MSGFWKLKQFISGRGRDTREKFTRRKWKFACEVFFALVLPGEERKSCPKRFFQDKSWEKSGREFWEKKSNVRFFEGKGGREARGPRISQWGDNGPRLKEHFRVKENRLERIPQRRHRMPPHAPATVLALVLLRWDDQSRLTRGRQSCRQAEKYSEKYNYSRALPFESSEDSGKCSLDNVP